MLRNQEEENGLKVSSFTSTNLNLGSLGQHHRFENHFFACSGHKSSLTIPSRI